MRYPIIKTARLKKMRLFVFGIKKIIIFAVIKNSVIKNFAYDIKA